MGYAIGLLLGIPLFIIVVNFLFFRGNNPTEIDIKSYIDNSLIDTIKINHVFPEGEQYIVGLSRRGQPSAFLSRYPFYSEKYKKFFEIMIFEGFDPNTRDRYMLLGNPTYTNGNPILAVKINQTQLKSSDYGSKKKPIPVFAIDLLNLTGGFTKDPFHVSDQANFIFVEQYLKFFMSKDEFKKMFKNKN